VQAVYGDICLVHHFPTALTAYKRTFSLDTLKTAKGVATADLILASRSPRRKYLLEQAGLTFRVIPSGIDESHFALSSPAEDLQRLAHAKALDVARAHPFSWVLGADTIVAVDGRTLGKPGSTQEARAMLQRLSGKTHQVYTGYCLVQHHHARSIADTARTDVVFKTLSSLEIDWYISTGEPFDKAGAYAIQGIGTFLVRRINGSYTNVVGLPVCEVLEILLREAVVGLDPQKTDKNSSRGQR
jgi:septum formation protein